jgi:hypothetical protein
LSGVIGLGSQPLELLGKLEQLLFDIGAYHKTDEGPDLAPLLAIVVSPGFRIRHHQLKNPVSLFTRCSSKASK